MGMVKDFLATTAALGLGLFALERKQQGDLEALYKEFADARGISVEEAKAELAVAERHQAHLVDEKAQRKAEARKELMRSQDLRERMKVWAPGSEREAHSTHR